MVCVKENTIIDIIILCDSIKWKNSDYYATKFKYNKNYTGLEQLNGKVFHFTLHGNTLHKTSKN